MRLPDQVLRTCCFLSHKTTQEPKFGGTAFVASVRGSHGNAFMYLVTAKHVT